MGAKGAAPGPADRRGNTGSRQSKKKASKKAPKRKPASEPEPAAPERPAPPPVNPGQVHDLTNFANPPFRFKLLEINDDGPTGKEVVTSLDHQMVAIDLASRLPTVMRPYGEFEKDEESGEMIQKKTGLSVILECFFKGEQTPSDLPSLSEVMVSVRKVFKIPQVYGAEVVMAVMQAFMKDTRARYALKKGMPDSHGSSEPSPVS